MTDVKYTDEEIRANRIAWVKALRSGRYKQGRGGLLGQRVNGNPTYCCLGVAARIHNLPAKALGAAALLRRSEGRTRATAEALVDVARACGLHGSTQNKLARMNDDMANPSDFKAIADWIEKRFGLADEEG